MTLRIAAAGAAAALLLLLTSCASEAGSTMPAEPDQRADAAPTEAAPPEEAKPFDLTGEWKQTNSADDAAYQAATISDGVIAIDWVNETEKTRAIYWVGTYEAPADAGTTYMWESVNDHTQTENAILASSDDTKTFTYTDGVLSYEMSALGVTQTVELEKQ